MRLRVTEEDRGGACPGDEAQSDRGGQRGACPGDEAQSDREGQRGGGHVQVMRLRVTEEDGGGGMCR